MARFSSIGSPLLSIIRGVDFPFSQGASLSTIPPKVSQFLNAISPRAYREASILPFVSAVTVSAFLLVETRAGFLAKTTYSITDSKGQYRPVIEYCWLLASHLSALEQLTGQRVDRSRVHQTGEVQLFRVWTSPEITGRGRKLMPELSSVGSVVGASHA